MMHTGIGRAHPLHVEYVHVGAALAVIQDVLGEAILSHPRLHMARKIALVKALGKVIWIQNDLFARWYVTDGDEFTAGVDYGEVVEKEGWLHGKRVIRHEDEDGDEAVSSSSGGGDGRDTPCPGETAAAAGAGVCPFTGVTASMGDLKIRDDRAAAAKPNGEQEVEVALNGQ